MDVVVVVEEDMDCIDDEEEDLERRYFLNFFTFLSVLSEKKITKLCKNSLKIKSGFYCELTTKHAKFKCINANP